MIKHGHHTKKYGRTKEYIAWDHMKRRCNNPTDKRYSHYGERGITVCDMWLKSFGQFFLDMGFAPSPKHSLDRINNDGNYEPGNCRWATIEVQQANRRKKRKGWTRKASFIQTPNGLMHKKDVASGLNITMQGLNARINRGLSIDVILSTKRHQRTKSSCTTKLN